ncbi:MULTISPECIES: AI-2E family transporter [unclassified Paraburkholderia]|uniref:AI-2E family transporter n=1 Tax=unclassified Paraburkholderia TaxID=2615204 RepID=UPI001611E73F|nr:MULTISPECIES: AI-2E family transporter [unclassified Paraburkholderia]MBB5446647.1 putative PurR-regulated permease PerM [Paraburkholderia sp. WSM4177]MBB5487192.1 putative PurR-regulated permease PerM [Paraburkholderia sp. WSM4180]
MNDTPEPRGTSPAARIQAASTALGIEGLVTFGVGVIAVACLYVASAVMIPITLAILLSFLVAPLADALSRLKLGHVASVCAAVLISVSVIALLCAVIATQLTDLAAGMPRYQATIQHKIDTVHSLTIGKLNRFASEAGQALQRATIEPPQPRAPNGAAAAASPQASTAVPVEVREPVPTPFELARRVLSPAISPLETALIVFVVTIVILLQRDDLRDRAIRLFGSRDLHRTTTVMDETARRLSRYFVSQLGVNTGVGVVIGAGLFLIGVPSPILWGILAALLRLVPYVGIWIAAILPTALAAAVSPGWAMAIWSLVLFVVAELAVGQVVEPLLYGRSTGLSPFSVVVAAIFWSWIWGPIGLILSTPLTLCLLVLGRHVRRLEFLDVLLGDQPALTPVENFYQRALAGDPDEAIEQAEVLLRDRSLSAYYDEVAIKGLRLAANDLTRGSVTSAQLARIESTTNDLVDGLDGYEDREPAPLATQANPGAVGPLASSDETQAARAMPRSVDAANSGIGTTAVTPEQIHGPEQGAFSQPSAAAPVFAWHAPTSRVLCLPGRGPFDALATIILLQLLGKHGFAARSLPHEAVSRASIDSLVADDVGIVCLLYLQIDGIPSHLRNLIRRIRTRLPNVSIVVGLWTPEDTQQWSAEQQESLEAECSVTSLQQMLAACRRIDATRTVIAEPQFEHGR